MSGVVADQMLQYIYGGRLDISPYCSMLEVAAMADMYGLGGLQEIVAYNLKRNRCHFFHKVGRNGLLMYA